MNLSYLFKMRFIVLFTYFTFLLQKKQYFVTFFYFIQPKKHHPQKRVMLQILRNIYIASCTAIGYIRQPGVTISCEDLVIVNRHAFIIVG